MESPKLHDSCEELYTARRQQPSSLKPSRKPLVGAEHSNGNFKLMDFPATNWIKVHFDGFVHDNNNAGLGCVIQGHDGDLNAAKGIKYWSRSINMTELRSAQAGLELAKLIFGNTQGVILEGDSAISCKRLKQILTGTTTWDAEQCIAKMLKDAPRI